MKHLSELTDSELVAIAQKTAAKYTKAYSEAKEIAHEYGFEMGETESNILNVVFAKLKEKRDTVTRESVEQIYQNALVLLGKQGKYTQMQELLALFQNGKYDELLAVLTGFEFYDEIIKKNTLKRDNRKAPSLSAKDHSIFSINGKGDFKKRQVAAEVVKLFAIDHPKMSAGGIVAVFDSVANAGYSWYFLTGMQYVEKKQNSKDSNFDRRYIRVQLPNGDYVYVSNQYNIKSVTEFIENVNRQDWGITIEKL